MFSTVRIENVRPKKDNDGNTAESKTELARNLVLPLSMLGLITKFENFKPAQEELPEATCPRSAGCFSIAAVPCNNAAFGAVYDKLIKRQKSQSEP